MSLHSLTFNLCKVQEHTHKENGLSLKCAMVDTYLLKN